jgi:hypothetical protein
MVPVQKPPSEPSEEMVDEASAESFPASDAPAWTAARLGSPTVRPALAEHARELRASLRGDVERLEATRHGTARAPSAVEDLVAAAMLDAGHSVTRSPADDAGQAHNVECELRGAERGASTLVVGARFDRADESGVAMLLALLRGLGASRTRRALRLVAIASPLGGQRYAERLRAEGVPVRALVSLGPLDLARDRRRAGALFLGDLAARNASRAERRSADAASWIPARALWLPAWWPGAGSTRRATFGRVAWPVVTVRDAAAWRDGRGRPPAPDVDRMAAAVPGVIAAVVRLAGGRV